MFYKLWGHPRFAEKYKKCFKNALGKFNPPPQAFSVHAWTTQLPPLIAEPCGVTWWQQQGLEAGLGPAMLVMGTQTLQRAQWQMLGSALGTAVVIVGRGNGAWQQWQGEKHLRWKRDVKTWTTYIEVLIRKEGICICLLKEAPDIMGWEGEWILKMSHGFLRSFIIY